MIDEKLPVSILFVEDEEVVREYVKKILSRRVEKLYLAENGKQGINVFVEKNPDIVISDIVMPEMDGITMARSIKNMNGNTQIIIMSAHNDSEYLVEIIDFGFNGYIIKPVKKDKLIQQINKCYESIKTKQELEQKKILINTLMNVFPYPVYVKDENCKFIMNNRAGIEMFDTEGEKLLGKNDIDIFGEKLGKRYVQEEKEIISTGIPLTNQEEEFIKSNGESVWQLITKVPFKDEKGIIRGIVGLNFDITEQKKMNIKLQEAIRKAEEANKAKDDFLAKMSHEFRNPMNSIIGLTEVMTEDDTLNEKLKNYLSLINSSAFAMLDMINEILDYAKIKSGKMKFIEQNVDIRKLFESVSGEYEVACRKKGVVFESIMKEGEFPDFIRIDGNKIRQILNNLLGNAIKFTDYGKISLEMRKDSKNQYLIIVVSDTGIGIVPEKQEEIFETFTQANDEISANYGGTGLGLSIIKSIVEHYNGEIKLESLPSLGSKFTVKIPYKLVKEDENLGFENKKASAERVHIPDDLQILLADDNKINRQVFSAMLEKSNTEITHADNGKEALEIFQKRVFDIVFLDIQMPVMNGIEATEKIREYEDKNKLQKTPIIGLSAHTREEQVKKCMEKGMDDYLVKPYKINDLLNVISRNIKNISKVRKIATHKKEPYENRVGGINQVINFDKVCDDLRIEKDLLLNLLKDYIKKYDKKILDMRNAVKNKDFQKINRLTHEFKGTTGMFTNEITYEKLLTLENDAKNRNIENLSNSLSDYENEVEKIREFIMGM